MSARSADGFTREVLAAVFKELEQLTRTSRPVKEKPLDRCSFGLGRA